MFPLTAIRYFLFFIAAFLCQKISCNTSPKLVEEILLQSGGCMDMDEFTYLTEISVGSSCTEETLKKAREMLGIKKRFKSISLEAHTNSATKKLIISCNLEPNLILKKVKIRGFVTSKPQYEHLYSIQVGDIYSESAHLASIKTIKEKLKTEGYLKSTIIPSVIIDNTTKTVSVILNIDTGPRFFIKSVQYSLQIQTKATPQIIEADIKNCLKNILNPLIHRYQYNHATICTWTAKIKEKLINEGFINPNIQVKIVANKTTCMLSIVFIITITTPKFIISGNNHCSQKELFKSLLNNVGQKWMIRPLKSCLPFAAITAKLRPIFV